MSSFTSNICTLQKFNADNKLNIKSDALNMQMEVSEDLF